MGLYTTSRSYTGAPYTDDITVNESYNNSYDLMCVLNDNQRNDMALFEATIYDDINEVQAYREGVKLEAVSKLKSLAEKIKELLKTLWSKIKGIFEKFIIALKRLHGDSDKIVKQYSDRIAKCTNWTDFVCKDLYIPKDHFKSNIAEKVATGKWGDNHGNPGNLAVLFRPIDAKGDSTEFAGINLTVADITGSDKKESKEVDFTCLAVLDTTIYEKGISDPKKYHEHVLNQVYGDTSTSNVTSDIIDSPSFFMQDGILDTLKNGDKSIKATQELEKYLNKLINVCIKNIDQNIKIVDAIQTNQVNNNEEAKNKPYELAGATQETTAAPNDEQKYLGAMSVLAGNMQNAITIFVNEVMGQTKLALAQARKLWLSAASWASSSHKAEAVTYCNALGDVALDETYYEFEREDL